jgi:hypothetical protein
MQGVLKFEEKIRRRKVKGKQVVSPPVPSATG